MARVSDDEVTDVVRVSLAYYELQRPVWRWYQLAYKTQFWSDNMFSPTMPDLRGVGDDGQPFKIEANKVWPFVQALVANLFYRNPRTQVELPRVWDMKPAKAGRKKKLDELPDVVSGYLDEFLERSGVREQSTMAYQLALMYEVCAFKLGIDMTKRRKGDLVSRTWVRAIPHWELILDRDASALDQQAYRGHLRYELREDAEEIVQESIPEDERLVQSDYLADGFTRPEGDLKPLRRYVRLLEFYDLLADEQRFYLVTGGSERGAVAKPIGKIAPRMPYEYPDGTPGVPILPVILSNVPEKPCQGIAAVSRVYQLNAEQNAMLTTLANAFRRDAGRVILHKEGIPEAALAQIQSGRDLTLVPMPSESGSLAANFQALDLPQVSGTLDKYMTVLQSSWSETQGATDLMQGKQGDYLSATEASLLAGFGEATSGDLQQRMALAMAALSRFHLTVTAAEMKRPVGVRVGSKILELEKDTAEMPWNVSIVDSAATPVRDMRKKEGFIQILPQLIQLAQLASGGTQEEPTPPAVQRLAQEILNYMQQLWALPQSFSWDALAVLDEQRAAEETATAEEQVDSRGRELLGRLEAMVGAPGPLQEG